MNDFLFNLGRLCLVAGGVLFVLGILVLVEGWFQTDVTDEEDL